MNQPLRNQKRIDACAIIFLLILFALIAFTLSFILALSVVMTIYPKEPGIDNSLQDGMAFIGIFFAALAFLSPLWLWLAFKVRRAIGWPKHAFENADFTVGKSLGDLNS